MQSSASYVFTTERKSDYLHAKVTGKNTKENIAHYLADVLQACMKHQCSKVLIEENLEGMSLGTRSMFDVIYTQSKDAAREGLTIAYVDVNTEHESKLLQYGEIVARQRGLNTRIFSSVAEAEQWLAQSSDKNKTK